MLKKIVITSFKTILWQIINVNGNVSAEIDFYSCLSDGLLKKLKFTQL